MCRASYKSRSQLCIDEQLVVYRGRCPFKIYIPRKPGKHGLKVWACCGVDTSHVCSLELYTNKQGRTPEVDQATRVVLQMIEPWNCTGRGCTADNLFTSFTLADALLTRKITYCETVWHNRSFLPLALLDTKQRSINTVLLLFSMKRRWYRIFLNVGRMLFLCPHNITTLKYIMSVKIKCRK